MNRLAVYLEKHIQHLAGRDRRDLPLEMCELKFAQAGANDPVEFEGYGSVWGRVDSYGDTVIKGAFGDALKARRPMMLFGHNPGRVPGKWVDTKEDDQGLMLKGQLTPGHSEAKDIGASLKHGALNGLSIGGYTTDWEAQKSGGRIIKAFDLYEVSIVSMPAEQEARIDTQSVKAMVDSATKLSDFESVLREAGFSKDAATSVVSRIVKVARGDPAADLSELKAAGAMLEAIRDLKIPSSLLGD
jgi:HK97 family phage prohead protease